MITIKGTDIDNIYIAILNGRSLYVMYKLDGSRQLLLYNESGVQLMKQVEARTMPNWALTCSPQLKARLHPWIKDTINQIHEMRGNKG